MKFGIWCGNCQPSVTLSIFLLKKRNGLNSVGKKMSSLCVTKLCFVFWANVLNVRQTRKKPKKKKNKKKCGLKREREKRFLVRTCNHLFFFLSFSEVLYDSRLNYE